jgi:hypothetical protein
MNPDTFSFEELPSGGFLIRVSKIAPAVVFSFLAELGEFDNIVNGEACYRFNHPDDRMASYAIPLVQYYGMTETDIIVG